MTYSSKPIEETVTDYRALYEARAVRLGDELDRLVKIVGLAREGLENELMSGLGYKRMTLTDKDAARVRSLASAMDLAVSAKVRYDKAMKDMTANMTPDEEMESVLTYIRSLPYEKVVRIADQCKRLRYLHTKVEDPAE